MFGRIKLGLGYSISVLMADTGVEQEEPFLKNKKNIFHKHFPEYTHSKNQAYLELLPEKPPNLSLKVASGSLG